MEVLFRAEVDNTQLLTMEDTKLLEYIDGKYYAIGYLNSENKIEIKNDKYIYAFKIKEKTKSINFPDMLDSQGNKIFSSLSKDGKGGDIFQYNNFTAYRELDNQTSTVVINQGRYALLIGDNFHSLFAIQGKVIGIQK